jgi:hypothetical protein
MYQILQVASILLVAIGMGLSLAHALEYPGKLRLTKQSYAAVQTVYYPGFTIGGLFGEVGAIIATGVLLVFTPFGSTAFWLTAAALAGLIAVHAIYWLVTHPVNRFWLRDEGVQGPGAKFFALGGASEADRDWIAARNQWELSHVARAVIAMASLLALVIALSGDGYAATPT